MQPHFSLKNLNALPPIGVEENPKPDIAVIKADQGIPARLVDVSKICLNVFEILEGSTSFSFISASVGRVLVLMLDMINLAAARPRVLTLILTGDDFLSTSGLTRLSPYGIGCTFMLAERSSFPVDSLQTLG